MDLNEHTTPQKLEHYSFLWSEARLVIAAVALFIGGYPPILAFNPIPGLYGPIRSFLTLSWIISGLVSAYLVYRWYQNKQVIFGGKRQYDTVAFFINIVTGFNLGLTGLMGNNIGMSVSSNKTLFIIVGVIYLTTAWYLYQRWNENKQRIF